MNISLGQIIGPLKLRCSAPSFALGIVLVARIFKFAPPVNLSTYELAASIVALAYLSK